jgi:hypothetical protein
MPAINYVTRQLLSQNSPVTKEFWDRSVNSIFEKDASTARIEVRFCGDQDMGGSTRVKTTEEIKEEEEERRIDEMSESKEPELDKVVAMKCLSRSTLLNLKTRK